MDEPNLTVEHLQFARHRQEYHAERARGVFELFIKIFVTLAGGCLVLISAKGTSNYDPTHLHGIFKAAAVLLTFLGTISIIQISLNLKSWHGARCKECEISSSVPEILCYWWLYESLYCIAIAIAIGASWLGAFIFKLVM